MATLPQSLDSDTSSDSLAGLFSPEQIASEPPIDPAFFDLDPDRLEQEFDEVLGGKGDVEVTEITEITEVSPPVVPPKPQYRQVPTDMIEYFVNEMPPMDDMVATTVGSLLDPYSLTRIVFPVKLTRCIHFECFDLERFCQTYRIPHPMVGAILRELRHLSSRRREGMVAGHMGLYFPTQNALNLDRAILFRTKHAMFRCPICDLSFTVSQLYKPESMDYLLQNTASHVKKIEMPDSLQFREVDDSPLTKIATTTEEVVVIEDDDDDDDIITTKSNNSHATNNTHNTLLVPMSFSSLPTSSMALRTGFADKIAQFRDLDFFFPPFDRPPQATGTADDPVTID